MAERIQVSSDKLRMHAAELRYCSHHIRHNRARIDQVVKAVDGVWTGDSITALIDTVEQDVEYIEKLCTHLESLAEMIESVVHEYEETELNIISQFHIF